MRRAFAPAVLAWSSLAPVRRIATVGTVHVCEATEAAVSARRGSGARAENESLVDGGENLVHRRRGPDAEQRRLERPELPLDPGLALLPPSRGPSGWAASQRIAAVWALDSRRESYQLRIQPLQSRRGSPSAEPSLRRFSGLAMH
jgi:hypothetical protein